MTSSRATDPTDRRAVTELRSRLGLAAEDRSWDERPLAELESRIIKAELESVLCLEGVWSRGSDDAGMSARLGAV